MLDISFCLLCSFACRWYWWWWRLRTCIKTRPLGTHPHRTSNRTCICTIIARMQLKNHLTELTYLHINKPFSGKFELPQFPSIFFVSSTRKCLK